MDRSAFMEFLSRSVADGFLTQRLADELMRRFDAGLIESDDQPAPLGDVIQEADDRHALLAWLQIAAIAGITAIALRGKRRDSRQDEYQLTMRKLAEAMSRGEISVATWAKGASEATRDYQLEMAMLGKQGKLDAEGLARVNEALVKEQAYLSRFVDEVAAGRMKTDLALENAGLGDKTEEILQAIDDAAVGGGSGGAGSPPPSDVATMDERMSEKQAGARADTYGGSGRSGWFKENDMSFGDGWVINYIAIDDGRTCVNCKAAEEGGPYLLDDPQRPFPGSVCLGGGRCRCDERPKYDPAAEARLRRAA